MKEYLALRPSDARSALRLYAGFLMAGVARVLFPARYRGLGPYIFGTTPLHLESEGLRFQARPHSEDLYYVLPGHKAGVRRHFAPARGQTVIEVGSHLGFFSVLAGVRGARVIAIEPNPAAAELLRINARLNGVATVDVVPLAISDTDGAGILHVPEIWDGKASLIPSAAAGGYGTRLTEIPVVLRTLDRALEGRDLPRVDWLLIDTEGSELAVLAGASAVLARTVNLLIEVSGHTADTCRHRLKGAGFQITAEEPQSRWTSYLIAQRDPPGTS